MRLQHPEVVADRAATWEDHLAQLEDVHTRGSRDGLHYRIVRRLLNAADYGVPQVRERVFIVGFRQDLNIEWHFPEPTHSKEKLQYDQWISGEYWEERDLEKPALPAKLAGAVNRLPTLLPPEGEPWPTLRDAISDLPEPSVNGHRKVHTSGHRKVHTWDRLPRRERSDRSGDRCLDVVALHDLSSLLEFSASTALEAVGWMDLESSM